MNSLIVKNRSNLQSTTISNIFMDEYMPKANGEFVKIYLYLIRCISNSDIDVSVPVLADKFNHTENDVKRALRYWNKEGLVELIYNDSKELTEVILLEPAVSSEAVTGSVETKSGRPSLIPDPIPERKPKPSYTSAQLKLLAQKEELSQLLYIAQKYLGKTLSPTETNTIIYFYETLHFPTDLIEYLIEYCVSKDHKSIRYIEKVALSWADANIRTVAEAKSETSLYNKNIYTIMKAFGLGGRSPGSRELEYISKWNDIYGFTADIITEACNRTIQTIHQPSFEYADSILANWKEKKVVTLRELAALDEQFTKAKHEKEHTVPSKSSGTSNRFNNFPQRNYNYEELEKQLIGNNN